MSQALQTLNSILKYRNERERQKIDRSLSMMDMATRIRQQRIDNARQERMMQLREVDARRNAEESAARLTNLNLQRDKLTKSMSEEVIEDINRKSELETKKLELEVRSKERKLINENVDSIKSSLDNMIRNRKENIFNETMSIIPGFQNLVRGSTLASQDFEESDINTVVKNYSKYAKNKEQEELLKYVTKNHRSLISSAAAVDLVGFKTSEDSVVESISSLYQDIQTNKKLQKLIEKTGTPIDNLSSNMINLSNIIRQENTYNSFIQSGDIEIEAKRLLKDQGLDGDSLMKQLSLQVLGFGNMSNEDIDALNDQRIQDGLEAIPYEEFR